MRKSEFHSRIAELLEEGRRFAVATILEVKGSAPQSVGAGMIVFPDSAIEGTIGGGVFEAEVKKEATGLLRSGCKSVIKEYNLTEKDLGMYCEGATQVFIEAYSPDAELLIFGAGHVGSALARLASETGLFRITLIDDRPEYAVPDPKGAYNVILTDRDYTKDVPEVTEGSFLVIVTRCHPTDRLLVERYAGSGATYVGMIGSKAKRKNLFGELKKKGVPDEALKRVHSPIGLAIGGKSPAEVAVSILAELVKVRYELLG